MSDVIKVVNDANFDSEVLSAEQPVLVDFTATWCGPCQRQTPILEKYATEHTNVKIVKVDVDDSPNIAAKYQVRGVPTLMLVNKGQVLGNKVGLTAGPAIESFISEKTK